jgi:hypothetical protein
VDDTDGKTAEIALTIAQADMQLSKDGAAFAQKNAAGNATHDTDGWYSTTLNTTDTNTVGELYMQVIVAGALPVWVRYWIIEEAIYDAIYGASAAGFDANQRVDVGSWLGTAVTTSTTTNKPEVDVNSVSDDAAAANNLEADYDGAGYNKSASTIGTATNLGTGAVNAAALATDAVTEIRSLANGTADSGSTTTMVDAARTEADTDYWKGKWILFTSGTIANQVRLITDFNPATDTITFAPATTQAVSTNTYEILPAGNVDLRQWLGSTPNALVGGAIDADVSAIQANVITATAIAANALTAAKIAANAITSSQLADNAITAAKLAADAITAAKIATDAVNEIRDAILADSIAFNGADIAAILADTDDIGVAGAGLTDLGGMSTGMKAQVNTEVTDVLTVDTFSEVGQEAPAATQSILKMLQFLYKSWRNKSTQNSTTYSLFADDTTTVDQKATVSDDGTTATKNEVGTGP